MRRNITIAFLVATVVLSTIAAVGVVRSVGVESSAQDYAVAAFSSVKM